MHVSFKQFTSGCLLAFLMCPAWSRFTASDFLGAWDGDYSWETNGGGATFTTLTFHENGQYNESSLNVYGTLYPNTNMWEYNASTNWIRLYWVSHIYNGQPSYTEANYFVLGCTETSLELVYVNEYGQAPAAGRFVLSREETSGVVAWCGAAREASVLASFNVHGQRINPQTPGVLHVQHMSDGTVRKRFVLQN